MHRAYNVLSTTHTHTHFYILLNSLTLFLHCSSFTVYRKKQLLSVLFPFLLILCSFILCFFLFVHYILFGFLFVAFFSVQPFFFFVFRFKCLYIFACCIQWSFFVELRSRQHRRSKNAGRRSQKGSLSTIRFVSSYCVCVLHTASHFDTQQLWYFNNSLNQDVKCQMQHFQSLAFRAVSERVFLLFYG